MLTKAQRTRLLANGNNRDRDHYPAVKLFNPCGVATWLFSELDGDGDTLFGLVDLGFGSPELGCCSLAEIAAVRLPFGLAIERDLHFRAAHPLSVYVEAASVAGRIVETGPELDAATGNRKAAAPPRRRTRIRPGDVVLEPSAGMLAVMAACALGERVKDALHLNEIAPVRADLLAALFPAVTRHNAEAIADRLPDCRPTVVLMNPPFSATPPGPPPSRKSIHPRTASSPWPSTGAPTPAAAPASIPASPSSTGSLDPVSATAVTTVTAVMASTAKPAPPMPPSCSTPSLRGCPRGCRWNPYRSPPARAPTCSAAPGTPNPRHRDRRQPASEAAGPQRHRRQPMTGVPSPNSPSRPARLKPLLIPPASAPTPAPMRRGGPARCAFRAQPHIRRPWCSPPPWPRCRIPCRPTVRCCPSAS